MNSQCGRKNVNEVIIVADLVVTTSHPQVTVRMNDTLKINKTEEGGNFSLPQKHFKTQKTTTVKYKF